MLTNFQSIFKDELNLFIQYKKSLGYDYKQQVLRLKKIDNILFELKLKSKIITKATFEKLIERKNTQKENYNYQVVNDFCKFLISNEFKNIYYIDKKWHANKNYIPTILNDGELKKLFGSCDYLLQSHRNKRQYHGYCIIIRLLYSCGLRISEALNICFQDIDLSNKIIKINDSKNHTSRIVCVSDSMNLCLTNYVSKFNIQSGPLFINHKKQIIKYHSFSYYFKSVLKLSDINKMHLHDLRHCFCNNAFNQMIEKGYDENVVLVYLHKYMGHKNIYNTEYYLHFTDYNKKKLIEQNDAFSKKMYESVDFENEE